MPGNVSLAARMTIVTHWPLGDVNDKVRAIRPKIDPMPDQIERIVMPFGGDQPVGIGTIALGHTVRVAELEF